MSTRSRIGIERGDGSIQSIYCHWDGHPETVGMTLAWGYRMRGTAEALVALGDLSALGEGLEGCDAYCRDQDEAWTNNRPESHPDAEAYREEYADGMIAYVYLFREGGWRVWDRGEEEWRPLPRFAPGEE